MNEIQQNLLDPSAIHRNIGKLVRGTKIQFQVRALDLRTQALDTACDQIIRADPLEGEGHASRFEPSEVEQFVDQRREPVHLSHHALQKIGRDGGIVNRARFEGLDKSPN